MFEYFSCISKGLCRRVFGGWKCSAFSGVFEAVMVCHPSETGSKGRELGF